MLTIMNIMVTDANTPEDMIKGYVEVMLLSDPKMYACIKNASTTDISKLNDLYQVDISGAVAALNNVDKPEAGTGVNNLPMLSMLEAKNANDTLFFKAMAAFNEYKAYMKEVGANYKGIVEPKYAIAQAKVALVVKYFESSK